MITSQFTDSGGYGNCNGKNKQPLFSPLVPSSVALDCWRTSLAQHHLRVLPGFTSVTINHTPFALQHSPSPRWHTAPCRSSACCFSMGVSKSSLDNGPILPPCVPKGPKPDVELPLHSVLSHQRALQLCQQKPYTHSQNFSPEAGLAADNRRQCLEQEKESFLFDASYKKTNTFCFKFESDRSYSRAASSFPTVSTLLRLIGWADSWHASRIWPTVERCSLLVTHYN